MSDLNKGQRGDWQKEGYEIRHELDPNGKRVSISAHLRGQKVGELDAGHSEAEPGSLVPVMTQVHVDHRRKGLATAMYQRAEQVLGAKFKRGSYQSPEAKALWAQKGRPFGKTEKLGKSQREKEVTQVASLAPFRAGKLLFGKRGDNGKWTTPGGHFEPGEDAEGAARRELKEETGLEAEKLERLGSAKVRDGKIEVHSYRVEVKGEPHADNDPDAEFVEFQWVDPKAIPDEILSNLHSPENVTLQLLGVQPKSLELAKALADIPVGEETWSDGRHTEYDYNHVLEPHHHESGYALTVDDDGEGTLAAHVSHNGTGVGSVQASPYHDGSLNINHSDLHEDHRGKGLGRAMYEALLAHALNAYENYNQVRGSQHSSMAARVHQSVAARHGLDYNGTDFEPDAEPKPFDDRVGPYRYTLKAEFSEIIERVKQVRGRIEQLAAGEARPMVFARRGGGRLVVSPDPSKPGRWRATHFSREDEPIGHIEAEDFRGALRAAHDAGADLMAEPLTKTRPGLRFPGLGLPDDRRETPIVDDPRQLEIVNRAMFDDGVRNGVIDRDQRQEFVRDDGAPGAASTQGGMHAYAKGDMMRLDYVGQGGLQRTMHGHNNAPLATQLHENLHLMFNRVQNKFGVEARHNLTANLLRNLRTNHPDAYAALEQFIKIRTPYVPGNRFYPEEHLTTLLNYVNNPGEREAFHSMLDHTPEQAQVYGNLMKRAYQHLDHTARYRVTPVWLEPPAESLVKSEPIKTENNLGGGLEDASPTAIDMLGFNPQVHPAFAAAQFLANGPMLSFAEIRAALRAQDSDYVAAALFAYKLPDTAENRAAVRTLMTMGGDLRKAQAQQQLPEGRSVVAGSPDAEGTARAIQLAFQQQQVRPVHLNGKHSLGSLLAKDQQADTIFLLKPGSGGQSVASGADQDPSSQSRREVAFWQVATAWGIGDSIPRADLVLIDGHEFAAIHMLPFTYRNMEREAEKDVGLPQNALGPYRDRGTMHQWAVLDYVLGNPDRHGQNLMVRLSDRSVFLIDHGSAFAGDQFDPAHDENSFVPYYLRIWVGDGFSKLPDQQKLAKMPTVSPPVREELARWLAGLHVDRLTGILTRFGIDPRASAARLAKVHTLAGTHPIDVMINTLWIKT